MLQSKGPDQRNSGPEKKSDTDVRFMSYPKCSNWCRILKLLSNFGCLFTFCYLDGTNSIKTDLHQQLMESPVCKLQVCNLVFNKFAQAE